MRSNRMSTLTTVALLAMGSAAVSPIQPAPIVAEAPRPRREMKRTARSGSTSYHFTYMNHGPSTAQQKRTARSGSTSYHFTYMNHGPSTAQQKRTARKARNVKRHRAASRG